ncbi:EpsG family protein [Photobacterium phosphoreum]|uniref:EpsG family protein n=1 Tax=Photobacterium phosphoreum TaxID=659 RepID=UPI001F9E0BAF|nr:hypothetical protein [Photobacterium phosphoreum]MCD9508546.1 hypothetical protein [Photobacterium phosphoreum]MCF2177798.1 hypothetical protein [Photobacterium phosphoreum]
MYIISDINFFLFFLIFLFLVFFSVFSIIKSSIIIDRTIFYFSFFLFVLFILNKTGHGVDEITYLNSYKDFLVNKNGFKFEIGFEILYDFLELINLNPIYFNSIISILLLTLMFFVVNKVVTKNRSIVFLMLIFSGLYLDLSFNIYRQAFSCLFFILSIYYFTERKDKKNFFLFFVISISFHWSVSIIYVIFILLFLFPKSIYKKLLLLSIILHFIVIIYPINGIKYIDFTFLEMLGIGDISNGIKGYILNSDGSFYNTTFVWKIIILFPVIYSSIFIYFNYRNDKYINYYILLILYSFVFIGMSYSFRNYYWAIIFIPFIFSKYISNKVDYNLIFIIIFMIVNAILGFYSSSILKSIYLSG